MADLYGSISIEPANPSTCPGNRAPKSELLTVRPRRQKKFLQLTVNPTSHQSCFWQAGIKTQRLIPTACSSLVTLIPAPALPNQMCLRSATIASDKSGRTSTGCQCRLSSAPTRSARGCATRTTPTYGCTCTRGTSTGSAANTALPRRRRMYRQPIRQPNQLRRNLSQSQQTRTLQARSPLLLGNAQRPGARLLSEQERPHSTAAAVQLPFMQVTPDWRGRKEKSCLREAATNGTAPDA